MERKIYQLCTFTLDQFNEIHDELTTSTNGLSNVPDREVECTDKKTHSETRGIFLLTEDEAAALENDDRIKSINLNYKDYPDLFKVNDYDVIDEELPVTFERYTKAKKNYRDFHTRRILPSVPNETDRERAGYQLLRCMQKDDPWIKAGEPASFVYNSNILQIGDGKDVDCIVYDNGCWHGHPEFQNNCIDSEAPANYVGGNKLPGNGTCDVLDLCLDAPYYLDPDFFDADPGNRLMTRFDGTVQPVESYARAWWSSTISRSSTFNTAYPDVGTTSGITSDYTRARWTGTNATNCTGGRHGTPCSSLVFGRTKGWAYNANKWTISAIGGTGAVDFEEGYDMIKIFHNSKPINSLYGTRDPTVMSNSWGFRSNLNVSGTWYYTFRNSHIMVPYTSEYVVGPWLYDMGDGYGRWSQELKPNSTNTALDEMVDAGVIVFCSGGNNDQKMVLDGHPDYDNFISKNINETSGDQTTGFKSFGREVYGYTNRKGHPAQGGMFTDPTTGKRVYKTISVGALDDGFASYSSTATDTVCAEDIAEYTLGSSTGGKYEKRAQYSSKGNAIDLYMPADGTLAALNYGSGELRDSLMYRSPSTYPGFTASTIFGSGVATDGFFNGTSAACPVGAGFFATLIGRNRNWTYEDVKNYIANLEDLDGSVFDIGRESTSPDDNNWLTESIEGGRPIVGYQIGTTFTTPPTGEPVPPTPSDPPGNQQSLSGASNLFIDNRLKMRNIIVR